MWRWYRCLQHHTETMNKKTTNKVRTSLVRKQNVIFVAMVAVGLSLTVMSQLTDSRLLSEGIAFIIVGFVGMLMSWTTMDVGASIKEAIHDVGRKNLAALESIAKSQKEIASSQKEIASSQKEIASSQKEIASSQKEMDTSLKEIASSQNEIKDILGTHTTILEKHTTILKNLEKKD